jgi:hypothetical protein
MSVSFEGMTSHLGEQMFGPLRQLWEGQRQPWILSSTAEAKAFAYQNIHSFADTHNNEHLATALFPNSCTR